MNELLEEYNGRIRVVLKHMVIHPPQVAKAHQAACAAAKQGKFREFYRAFWDRAYKPYSESRGQDAAAMSEDNLYRIAGDLGLDVDRLKAEMPGCQQVVEADEAELKKFRVSGTPAFFINGEFIGGGMSKEQFKQIIDKKLAIAEQSGVSGADYYDKEIRGKGEQQVERRRARKAN